MALSDAAVRHVKATGKAYTLGDIDGLFPGRLSSRRQNETI